MSELNFKHGGKFMCSTKRLLFMFAITFLWHDLNSALAQQYGWKVIARPTNRNLYAVEFTDALHGVCAGVDTIFLTIDSGKTWQRVRGPSNAVFTDISFSDLLHGWAVGNFYGNSGGLIWRTIDGGNSWSEQINPIFNTRRYMSTFAQSLTHNTTTGIKRVVADSGVTLQTINSGTTWKERTLADSITSFVKIVFFDPLHGWATAGLRDGHAAVVRTTDGGNTWKIVRTPYFAGISFISALKGWAITANSPTYAYGTTDGGATWQRLSGRIWDPLWDNLYATDIAFVDSFNGWAFGGMFYQGISTEAIYHTTDGGKTWLQESVGLSGDFGQVNDARMLDRSHGWAVCNDGSVLSYQLLTVVAEKIPQVPQGFALQQNHPNPFNAMTNIEYEVNRRAVVNITIYDLAGREIQQLVNNAHEPGVYRLHFDGSRLISGVYYYTMKAGSFSETKSMTMLK